jgi:hypothetical protein
MGETPVLRLLGYHERPPALRVIRVRDRCFEPAPASIDVGYALDACLSREGWAATHRSRFAFTRDSSLHLVDVDAPSLINLEAPEGGRWVSHGSFSNDGSLIAIEVNYSPVCSSRRFVDECVG